MIFPRKMREVNKLANAFSGFEITDFHVSNNGSLFNFLLQQFTQPEFVEQSTYILIAAGAIMFVLSFLGYCGAIRESQCMLSLVSFWLLFITKLHSHQDWILPSYNWGYNKIIQISISEFYWSMICLQKNRFQKSVMITTSIIKFLIYSVTNPRQ